MARKLKFQQVSALLVSLMLGLAHPEGHIQSCSIKNLFGFKVFPSGWRFVVEWLILLIFQINYNVCGLASVIHIYVDCWIQYYHNA